MAFSFTRKGRVWDGARLSKRINCSKCILIGYNWSEACHHKWEGRGFFFSSSGLRRLWVWSAGPINQQVNIKIRQLRPIFSWPNFTWSEMDDFKRLEFMQLQSTLGKEQVCLLFGHVTDVIWYKIIQAINSFAMDYEIVLLNCCWQLLCLAAHCSFVTGFFAIHYTGYCLANESHS